MSSAKLPKKPKTVSEVEISATDAIVEEVVTPDHDPPPVVHCYECKHWDRRWPTANMAPCQLSARFLPQPAMTTDLTTCGSGERRA